MAYLGVLSIQLLEVLDVILQSAVLGLTFKDLLFHVLEALIESVEHLLSLLALHGLLRIDFIELRDELKLVSFHFFLSVLNQI